MRRCVVLFFVLSSLCAKAQAPATPSQQPSAEKKGQPATQNAAPNPVVPPLPTAPAGDKAAAPDYSKEAIVIEHMITKVVFEKDGTGTREISLAARVQSQSGVQAVAVLPFAYLSSNETVEFDYVRVRKPDGTVVVTPDYNIQDMPADVTRIAPMYSDIHEKHVTVKALGVGDTLEYVVRYRTFKPQVPGQFWFDYTFPKDDRARSDELQSHRSARQDLKISSPNYKPEIKDEGRTASTSGSNRT